MCHSGTSGSDARSVSLIYLFLIFALLVKIIDAIGLFHINILI